MDRHTQIATRYLHQDHSYLSISIMYILTLSGWEWAQQVEQQGLVWGGGPAQVQNKRDESVVSDSARVV